MIINIDDIWSFWSIMIMSMSEIDCRKGIWHRHHHDHVIMINLINLIKFNDNLIIILIILIILIKFDMSMSKPYWSLNFVRVFDMWHVMTWPCHLTSTGPVDLVDILTSTCRHISLGRNKQVDVKVDFTCRKGICRCQMCQWHPYGDGFCRFWPFLGSFWALKSGRCQKTLAGRGFLAKKSCNFARKVLSY